MFIILGDIRSDLISVWYVLKCAKSVVRQSYMNIYENWGKCAKVCESV